MKNVKNISEDVRQFRDGNTGKMVLIEPGKSTLTNNPPEPSSVWEISEGSEKKEKKETPEKGEIKLKSEVN